VVRFTCGDDDRIVLNMRPGQAQQIAETQATGGAKVDCMADLSTASLFNPDEVGVLPDDLGAIAGVKRLDPFARVASDLTERVDRM
jgi:hypothetical protein